MTRFALAGILACTLAAASASAQSIHLKVSAGAARSAECTATAPCRRITDALIEARRIRSGGNAAPIVVHVDAGDYPGTFGPNPGGALEDLPLFVNVPDLSLLGSTQLSIDAAGLPCRPDGSQTVLRADQLPDDPLFLIVPLIIFGRAAPADDPVAVTGGDRGLLQGFTLQGTPIPDSVITVGMLAERVQGLTVLGNYSSGFWFGFTSSMSEVDFVANYIEGAADGNAFSSGGGGRYPSRPRFLGNRSVNGQSGLKFYDDAVLEDVAPLPGSQPLVQEPFDGIRQAFSQVAFAAGNDLTSNIFGIHVFSIDFGTPFSPDRTARLELHLAGNQLGQNLLYGLAVDSGVSPGASRVFDTHVTLDGDTMTGNGRAGLGLFFRSVYEIFAVFGGGSFLVPPSSSTIRIDGTARGMLPFDYFNPRCDQSFEGVDESGAQAGADPACAPALGNRGAVNGVQVPLGIDIHPASD